MGLNLAAGVGQGGDDRAPGASLTAGAAGGVGALLYDSEWRQNPCVALLKGGGAAGGEARAELVSLRVRCVAREGRVVIVAPPHRTHPADPNSDAAKARSGGGGGSGPGAVNNADGGVSQGAAALSRLEMAAAACGGCPQAEVEVWAVSSAADNVRVAGLRTR